MSSDANSTGLTPTTSDDDDTTFRSSKNNSVTPTPPSPLNNMSAMQRYEELKKLKLSEEEMASNGYPSWDEQKNFVKFKPLNFNRNDWASPGELKRKCSRCSKMFSLNPNGTLPPKPCVFHYRLKWFPDIRRKRYPCCQGYSGCSKGCMVRNSHVFYTASNSTLKEFVKTPRSCGTHDHRNNKVYCLDIESVFTLNGLELARVSLVDSNIRVILDTFVLPQFPIIDFNYDFSGVTQKDMEKAVTFDQCRAELFQLINEKTLLVGHSLESDLKSLRLVHSNIIDTSVLFSQTRKGGQQTKLSLKNLAVDQLGKGIQSGTHNSVEDASICMHLIEKYFQDNCNISNN